MADPTSVAGTERGAVYHPATRTRRRGARHPLSWITTVDHKRIGILYGVTAFAFFLIGGIEALIIRLQLARPNATVVSAETFNALFTMHGTTMVFLAVMPFSAAFFNYMIPLMIGARDVAFPRLNALSYWIFLFGGLFLNASFLVGAPPDGGWFGYTSLTLAPVLAGPGHRLLGARPADPGRLLDAGRRELHRHHPQHARARHDADADAGVRVDDARPCSSSSCWPSRRSRSA